MSELVDRTVDELLSLFDGDVEAAMQALKDQAREQRGGFGAVERQASAAPVRVDVDGVTVVSSPVQAPARQFDGPPIVSLKGVYKTYKLGKQTVEAVRGIDLDIYKGEIVAIVGPSGSGKSTLLQLIGCLDTPTEGVVAIDGQVTSKLHDRALSLLRRSTIGFIFQSFYLQPFLRLGDNVAVPAMFAGKRPRDIAQDTAALLGKVGLTDRRRHFPKELSGGQTQRAAIARALMNQPKIILADEPTGNLDSDNSAKIVELFQTIRNQLGTTVIIVTHNPEVAKTADRVINLKDGGIA